MSDLTNVLEQRALLKYFRDKMANHPKSSMLNPGILALNAAIEESTSDIATTIQEGRATFKDLFLALDYPTWKVDGERIIAWYKDILSDEQIAEIEARANAATEGPWKCHESMMWAHPFDDTKGKVPSGEIEGPDYIPDPECNGLQLHDAAFIAHAREDIPALIATIRALKNRG